MCGLFGIINKRKKLLDKRAFITLGCINDNRGGDSCGIMIDGKVEKGFEKDDKYFQNWYPKSKLLAKITECHVALGHCRKASVGCKTEKEAQPVCIRNSEGKILFCLIHNGTIYNYKELAEKYIPKINIEGMTDSQVMAYIFYSKGYDVLKEYEGAGAFVIQDYRNNKTYIFRGKSLSSSICKTPEEERPLYFVETGNSVIFSSIFSVLQGLYYDKVVYDMPSNVLLECDGHILYTVKEYNRENCKGYRDVIYTPYIFNGSTPNNNTYKGKYDRVEYDTLIGKYINTKDNSILDGVYHISNYGYINKQPSYWVSDYYFYDGIMVCGKCAYNTIKELEAKKYDSNKLLALIRRLSCTPVLIGKKYYTFKNGLNKEYLEIDYQFPLTETVILCDKKGKYLAEYENNKVETFVPADLDKLFIDGIVEYVNEHIK